MLETECARLVNKTRCTPEQCHDGQRVGERRWAGGQGGHSRRTSKGSNWEFMKLNGIGSGGGLVEGTLVMVVWKKSS